MTIQAIPTRYKGYHFRSRLEARWAVFFDALGIQWEYEPERYQLSNTHTYLPDFRLNNAGRVLKRSVFVEVKPEGDTFATAKRFARETGALILLLDGQPDLRTYPMYSAGGFTMNAVFLRGRLGRTSMPYENDGFTNWPLGVMDAVSASRSARFEHGECGAT